MPSATKVKTQAGIRWRGEANVEHKRGGKRAYKTHATKAAALAWAIERERLGGASRPGLTVAHVFDRYATEVSANKAGERWEKIRLERLKLSLGSMRLDRITDADLIAWRDARLREVSPASVNREMNLLSHCFTVAVKEWKWLHTNPVKGVTRPPSTPPRTKTYSDSEIARIMLCAGDDLGEVSGRVGMAFLFALETGMRAGEICGLTWDRVAVDHVHVGRGKTDAARRHVDLSTKARAILERLKCHDKVSVFGLSSTQLDANFRKIAKRACVEATFHDTRHSAATRIARLPGIDVLSLCRAFGWRDVSHALLYFNPQPGDMAAKLG